MLSLGELLVQAPEDLDDAQGGGGDGVGEVTTGRRHGAHNGDGALAARVADALHSTGSLVEGGESGAEVGRVARVGGHLRQSAGDFSERLCPSGGGVGHHGDVVAHVAEVLRQCDARVDGGLSSGHRHVGGVGHQGGALHDRLRLAVHLHGELGKVAQHLRHLIAALAAADVDDDVTVGVLGERLRDDRLAAAKGAGNGRRAALHTGKQRVEHSLTGQQWVVRR